MLERLRVIKVKLEVAKGTYLAGDQALLVFDLDCNAVTEHDDRLGDGKFLGFNNVGVHANEIGRCRFRTELRGNGTTGVEAGVGILLQGAGMKLTTATYTIPTSSVTNQKTISIDVFEDGKLKSLAGCMGTCQIEANIPGKAVYLTFEFMGRWIAPSASALPTFSPSTAKPMKMLSFTTGGTARAISRFNLDLGNAVVPAPDPNGTGQISSYIITQSLPRLQVDPDAVLPATWDVDSLRQARTTFAMVATFGDGTTVVTFTFVAGQIASIEDRGRDGIWAAGLNINCLNTSANAGDDALTITSAGA
jgi:hypothetical protein